MPRIRTTQAASKQTPRTASTALARHIGNQLYAKRSWLNRTQAEVAVHCGVTPCVVSAWERGMVCPNAYHLYILSQLFNVTPLYFIPVTRTFLPTRMHTIRHPNAKKFLKKTHTTHAPLTKKKKDTL